MHGNLKTRKRGRLTKCVSWYPASIGRMLKTDAWHVWLTFGELGESFAFATRKEMQAYSKNSLRDDRVIEGRLKKRDLASIKRMLCESFAFATRN